MYLQFPVLTYHWVGRQFGWKITAGPVFLGPKYKIHIIGRYKLVDADASRGIKKYIVDLDSFYETHRTPVYRTIVVVDFCVFWIPVVMFYEQVMPSIVDLFKMFNIYGVY